MSQITLKPLDDGQKAVEIPLGKTTIGRGPFLGCSDKKVSRNHAVLEVTSKGEVYLTPTHVNPCFYQPTAESPGQILKKDIPHKLENGDSFSLLPRAYRYQLSVVTDARDNKATEENDLKKEVGKTNGSAGDGLEEGGKDAMKGECTEEQGDTIVAEKTFAKEEETLENAEKKEENNFSEKLADIQEEQQQKSELSKDNSVPPKSSPEETPPEASPNEHSKLDQSEDGVASNTSHPSISSNPEPEQKEQKPDSLVCQNETINKNSKESEAVEASAVPVAPPEEEEPAKAEDSPKEEKSSEAETEDKKADDYEETKDEEMKDPVSPKEDEEELDTGKGSPVRTEEPATPSKRPRGKKAAAAKQATPKKQTPKRKPASESSPKPKGRKKTKLTFDDGGEGSSQQQVAGRTSSRTNRQTRQGLSLEDFIVSDDDEWQSDRSSERPKQQQRRRRRRDSDSGSDWETEHKKPKKPVHKLGSGSESGSDWGTGRKRKGGPRGKRRKNKSTASEPGSEEEAEQSTSNAAKSDKPRIPCTYGKKCFRKHPNHLEQFSHPGDSDYASEPEVSQKEPAVSESEADESPKKECPYGANCFRKNPQHKKDFKHTKKVRPQREAAKQADKKTKSSRNSGEVDTYDLNDSLLNDDSADEYKPMDSGSDYESGEKAKRTAKGRRGRRAA